MNHPVIVAGAGSGALARSLGAALGRPVTGAGDALPPLGAWHRAARAAPDLPPPPLPWPDDVLLHVPEPQADGLRALLHRWPQARLVVLHGGAIGFVTRRQRALPDRPFVEHCAAWAAAGAALATLGHDARVLVLDPAEPLAPRLAEALGVAPPDLPPPVPAPTLARTAWTLPEIELFAGLCGAAPEELAAAARARPLDLLAPLRDGQGRASGGLRLRWPPFGPGLLLRCAAGPCRLALPLLWPGGRDRLSLFLTAATRPVELELLVAGSLSRRPLLARALRLEPGEGGEVAALLPAADELLDVTLSAAPAEAMSFELRQARLFRL